MNYEYEPEFDLVTQHKIVDKAQSLLLWTMECEPLNIDKIAMLNTVLCDQMKVFDNMGMNSVCSDLEDLLRGN